MATRSSRDTEIISNLNRHKRVSDDRRPHPGKKSDFFGFYFLERARRQAIQFRATQKMRQGCKTINEFVRLTAGEYLDLRMYGFVQKVHTRIQPYDRVLLANIFPSSHGVPSVGSLSRHRSSAICPFFLGTPNPNRTCECQLFPSLMR